jgi:hypothetical protein
MLGTKEKCKKNSSPKNPQNLKEKKKKTRHFECMLSLPIGWMKFHFPKLGLQLDT